MSNGGHREVARTGGLGAALGVAEGTQLRACLDQVVAPEHPATIEVLSRLLASWDASLESELAACELPDELALDVEAYVSEALAVDPRSPEYDETARLRDEGINLFFDLGDHFGELGGAIAERFPRLDNERSVEGLPGYIAATLAWVCLLAGGGEFSGKVGPHEEEFDNRDQNALVSPEILTRQAADKLGAGDNLTDVEKEAVLIDMLTHADESMRKRIAASLPHNSLVPLCYDFIVAASRFKGVWTALPRWVREKATEDFQKAELAEYRHLLFGHGKIPSEQAFQSWLAAEHKKFANEDIPLVARAIQHYAKSFGVTLTAKATSGSEVPVNVSSELRSDRGTYRFIVAEAGEAQTKIRQGVTLPRISLTPG